MRSVEIGLLSQKTVCGHRSTNSLILESCMFEDGIVQPHSKWCDPYFNFVVVQKIARSVELGLRLHFKILQSALFHVRSHLLLCRPHFFSCIWFLLVCHATVCNCLMLWIWALTESCFYELQKMVRSCGRGDTSKGKGKPSRGRDGGNIPLDVQRVIAKKATTGRVIELQNLVSMSHLGKP